MIRLVLADDHVVLRAGLKSLLERQKDFLVVGEAADRRELLRVVDAMNPDVVITDMAMPKLNGTGHNWSDCGKALGQLSKVREVPERENATFSGPMLRVIRKELDHIRVLRSVDGRLYARRVRSKPPFGCVRKRGTHEERSRGTRIASRFDSWMALFGDASSAFNSTSRFVRMCSLIRSAARDVSRCFNAPRILW